MIHSKQTIFISDLHLDEKEPKICHLFFEFLNNCDPSYIDGIYILGDLFEVWIGDDNDTPFNQKVCAALKSVSQKNIPLFFIHGNRDFFIGNKFSTESGCQLLKEETVINLYGTRVLLMHGDTSCTNDVAYQQARKIFRNAICQKIYLSLPLRVRQYIANKIRKKSETHTQSVLYDILDVTQETVELRMQAQQVMHLIHGHVHRPAIHQFLIDKKPAQRLVLGAWHKNGNMLSWYESGEKELINFD
jgi:UDP-2,3-diacylglucosamine hydrolase